MKILNCYVKPIVTVLLTVLFSMTAHAQFWANKTDQLLPEEQAFSASAVVGDDGRLRVNWSIADGYYMYREQFSIQSTNPELQIGAIEFSPGVIENDPEFGEVVVYFFNAELIAELSLAAATDSNLSEPLSAELVLKGQGCNKPVGVCYPPISRTLSIDYSPTALSAVRNNSTALPKQWSSTETIELDEDDAISTADSKSFFGYVLSAFLAGILLSFTPCVLPMIPILAGVIAGQQNPSKMKSGWLAICYVGGTVVTYIIAGALAGATGAQLQAYFQNVWVIAAICLLLLALAASLFGWYTIALPSSIQSKLNAAQTDGKSASWSSFALGLISALVVGACVSPVLILALGAAITQGDPVLGAAIMGAMAMGMGLLMILFGFGAGWLLPRAGAWMSQVQVLFGFMVLGVAVYLLGSLPDMPSLYLWSALLLTSGFYVWQLTANLSAALGQSAIRALSAALLIWGTLAMIGGASQGDDVLRPLDSLRVGQAQQTSTLSFVKTKSLAEVQSALASAKQNARPVLIDFYADWCLDCKRMQSTTFKQASVHDALRGWTLIEIDVTDTSKISQEVKRHFKVFGPPATLFLQSDGVERTDLRQYGYLDERAFLALAKQVN